MPSPGLREFQESLIAHLAPWHRSFQFWIRAAEIYTTYKVCQFRVGFVKDAEKREAMWERQHELAADKMYSLCSEMGGLFLKFFNMLSYDCLMLPDENNERNNNFSEVYLKLFFLIFMKLIFRAAQILGKPDLAPAAWVRRLVALCDKAPATPIEVVRSILEKELGQTFTEMFESFDAEPIGSASIAQVHRARLRREKTDVAVKVQHPGVQQLMMIDIRNVQAFVLFLQKTDIKFDLFSLTKEIEKQVGYEFDFLQEAEAMERIRHSFHVNNKKVPVLVPHVIRDLVTRNVVVMEFINGIPIMNLGDEIAKRGIDPRGKIAAAAKQSTSRKYPYLQGLRGKDATNTVSLLDYGQVKQLSDDLRLGYANLVVALADKDPSRATQSCKYRT
ncbi:putative aarF domain-containing protein kinase 1-like [Cocos nucifera]|uniref:Putative aarF domain-containing protein kinase 1-like n=1 Tax=Cocos nucifera TaxID=13894 RepID=A0A8K0IGY9_COCNU|nr:putative aarF domain-containing protein kinase 1-like [Cocos nucifera]